MSNLQPIGVNAVVQGAAQYASALKAMADQTTNAGNQIKTAAGKTQDLDKATASAAQSITKLNPQVAQVSSGMQQLAEAAGVSGEEIAALAIPIAVAAAALVGFFALAERGAGFSDIENGFMRLTAAAGTTADALLTQLHTASQGTIDDIQLETLANNALLGVNADLQKSFGKDLPQMMSIARAVALATGRDTTQVFDSITEAIKRGQTRGLQAIGIIVDQKKAYDDYAKSIGISVKEMTKADQEQALLNATLKAGQAVTDELGNSNISNATKMQQATTTITNILDDLARAVQPVFSVILDDLNNFLTFIGTIVNTVAPYIQAFAELITGGLNVIGSGADKTAATMKAVQQVIIGTAQSIGKSIQSWFIGGAAIIGALAGGITYAANTWIYPAVIAIANFIADFLSGLSPPPMGPLHNIDQGGANVMLAWLEGATGVSLEPIAQVAANVNRIMGSIGSASLAQVKARLLELDQAIAPFQEQLDLVKTRFQQIQGVTTPAIDAIDRQISMLQQALANGDQTAAAQIKTLDAQKQKLQDYVDVQQESVDQAQIQLAMAQLQQGAERAVLTTRENMLKLQQSLTTATPKAPAAKQGKGGGATSGDTGGVPDLTPTAQQEDAATQAGDVIGTAYNTAFVDAAGDTGTAMLQANNLNLKAAGNRISAAVGNIGAQLDKALVQPFRDKVTDISNALNDLFGTGPYSISTWIGKLPGAFSDLGNSLYTNIVLPFQNHVASALYFFNGDNPDGLEQGIKKFVTDTIPTALANLGSALETNLIQPFINKVSDVISGVNSFFNDDGPGTLHDVFSQVMTFLAGLPDKVATAFLSLASALISHFVDPAIDALNGVLSGIASFINNSVIPAINNLLGVYNSIKSILPGAWPTIPNITANISFAPIAKPIIGAAAGGMFTSGLLQTHANELIAPAQKIGVFPTSFTTALDRLTAVLSRPATANNMYSNVYNNSQYNTFNGIQNAEDAIREFARLQAVSAH